MSHTLTFVSLYKCGKTESSRSRMRLGLLWAAELKVTRATLRTLRSGSCKVFKKSPIQVFSKGSTAWGCRQIDCDVQNRHSSIFFLTHVIFSEIPVYIDHFHFKEKGLQFYKQLACFIYRHGLHVLHVSSCKDPKLLKCRSGEERQKE